MWKRDEGVRPSGQPTAAPQPPTPSPHRPQVIPGVHPTRFGRIHPVDHPVATLPCEERVPAPGPLAVQIVKAMINAAEGEDSDAPIEGLAGALTAATDDLAEGVAAFRGKRAPRFVGH